MPATLKPILIIGAGSWGTALALYLARQGQAVRLWSIESTHVQAMASERVNKRYLPHCPFPASLTPVVDLATALQGVDDILIAVPSAGFRSTLAQLQPLLTPAMRIGWATKGLDEQSGQLLHETYTEVIGSQHPYAILSGPSFAGEVATGLPTAIVVASLDEKMAVDWQQRFNSRIFRVYLSSDIIGVEVGGVVKNVLAIATGISDGMGFGANARCALITRGLAEMLRLGLSLGGQRETLTGLTGVGDLVLTCTDNQSRNRRFGLSLGKGKNPADAEREIGQVVEGKRNAAFVAALAAKQQVDMPIVNSVWLVLQGKLTPNTAVEEMLSRQPRAE